MTAYAQIIPTPKVWPVPVPVGITEPQHGNYVALYSRGDELHVDHIYFKSMAWSDPDGQFYNPYDSNPGWTSMPMGMAVEYRYIAFRPTRNGTFTATLTFECYTTWPLSEDHVDTVVATFIGTGIGEGEPQEEEPDEWGEGEGAWYPETDIDTIYPAYPNYRGLAFTVLKAPEFDTVIKTSPGQIETRLAQMDNPIWHWVLTYNYLKDRPDELPDGFSYSDFRVLLGFILAHQGQYDDFLFLDPDDYAFSGALSLIQDYNTGIWYSPIQRSFGNLFREDISELGSVVVVFANGVLQTEGFNYILRDPGFSYEAYGYPDETTRFYAGYYIEWASKPAEPITAEFTYLWRVRFESDRQDLDKFMHQLWAIGGPQAQKGSGMIQLMSSRRRVPAPIAPATT